MQDIQPILNVLKDAMLHKLGDEVDLIFQYGSHVRGTPHPFSDVDISFVPAHEATWENITVMVGDTLFDFYPMRWSRLEDMAEYKDVSSSVLLYHRILYQRSQEVGARFQALADRLRSLQQPAAKAEMVHRAQEIFQSTAYDFYLLQVQARTDHQAGCLRQAQAIFRTVLHALAVCNQACIDTRKMDQVLALPRLPAGFAETANRMIAAIEPGELLASATILLSGTREFLLQEQREFLRSETNYPSEFDSGYPELKRDLQAVMQACERQDLFSLKTSLSSLLHEMSCAIAQIETGVLYSGFNGLNEYEQDLTRFGFPNLLPYFNANDLQGLKQQCMLFDQRLREFLTERDVALNNFTSLEELQEHLLLKAS